MAKVLLLVQLMVGLVVLPFWPGLAPQYALLGLVYLALALAVPMAAAGAVFGARTVVEALADAWSPLPRSSGSESARVWGFISHTFPAAGILGGLVALTGALSALGPNSTPIFSHLALVPLFALVWGLLGALVGRVLHQVVARMTELARPLGQPGNPAIPAWRLTPRETEVAALVLEGLTYRDIGTRLEIAPATVKSHVLKVYEKSGAGNKMELLRMVEAQTAPLHQKVDGDDGASRRS